MSISPESLLLGDASRWHDGQRTLTLSFVDRVPDYYDKIDTNDDGILDSYLISDDEDPTKREILAFDTNVGMSEAEKALTIQAVAEWNAVATLNAVIDGSGAAADITLASADFRDGLFGFVPGIGGTLGQPSPYGDLWINGSFSEQASAAYGNTGWQTFLHEFGHALGLEHPDDDPNNTTHEAGNDQRYTVMSYVPHPSLAALPEADRSWPVTPMQYDIAAVQRLYGANLTTRADDTRYFAPGSAYALQDGGLLENGRTAILTIWDAGGTDTLDASDQTGAVRLDLNPGAFSTIGPFTDTIAMSLAHVENGVVVNLIENATGGTGNDALTGNLADNVLLGRDGDDSVSGGEGNDFGSGGWGKDTVRGGAGNDLLFGDDDDDIVDGGSGDDHVYGGTGDDKVLGSLGDDRIFGEAGKDTVSGGEGNDLADGGEGDDAVTGGTGNDTLFGSGGADEVGGEAGNDFLGAGWGDDTATGGEGDDEVHGEDGNDALKGDAGRDGVYGEAGNDTVMGGTGDDYLTGDAGDDQVLGEDGDDRLSGGEDRDDLSGGAGADVMDGGAGTDLLFGNSGDDVLTGGTGADVFAFGAGDGLDRILDFVTGGSETDVIAFNGGAFADFAGVRAASRQDGADLVIAYGAGDALTLAGVQLGALSAANFSFA
ncbi:M10 family metallopeptidase [uncultured Methylobacterium sp.]|jgi:serralysin|uniref:M10 family metallopeptidase n=1 Tax=uncultured Methylobacterium sp. TaxID=157278 RepID=UPI00263652F3|nr:M10 family metallopeptidase [uncultured Methylobacterium sp.]